MRFVSVLLAVLPVICAQSDVASESSVPASDLSSSDVSASVPSPVATSIDVLSTPVETTPSSSSYVSVKNSGFNSEAATSTAISVSSSPTTSSNATTPTPFLKGPDIPFSDRISCRCPDGEAVYPACRDELPDYGTDNYYCTAEADCGPYTPILDPPSSGFTLLETPRPAAVDPSTFTDEEFETWKTMELELYTEFIKNDPIYGEDKVSLPWCGLGDYEDIGTPIAKRGVSWNKVFGSGRSVGERIFGGRPARPPQRPYCVPKRLSIPIHFNIFTTNCTSQYNVTDENIQAQVDEMNAAYKPLYISWTLGGIHRFAGPQYRAFTQNENDNTSSLTPDTMMNPAYRWGGVDVLHVFVVESITQVQPPPPKDVPIDTLGYCYFPGQQVDGCLIKFDTIPGVSFQRADRDGDGTLVHEAGHWMNLGHTHDETEDMAPCSGTDDVADTFQHAFANRFDPVQPICKNGAISDESEIQHNYMSYVTAKSRFTQGQRARMFTAYYFFRKGIKKQLDCTNVPVNYPISFKRKDTIYERLKALRATETHRKRSILGQRPNLINELKAICSVPATPDEDLAKSIPDANVDIRVAVDTENVDRPSVQPPSQDGTGTPGTGTPGTGTSGTGTPGTENPGSGTPGSGTPGTGTPGTANPGTGSPGTGTPGTENPGSGTPGTGTPGTGTPGTGTPGNGNPGTGSPDTGNPGAGTPPAGQDKGREIYHTTKQGTKCLDVKYDWRYNGSPVQLYECNGTPAQKWVIQKGETKVRLAGTNYCLDAGEHPGNFISMKLWQCYDGLPQQTWWYTADDRIAVKDQGQCLDLRDGVFENWATVQTYKCTDYNTNQIWQQYENGFQEE